MVPYIGASVLFVLTSGERRPAIVTSLNPDGTINGQVIPDPSDAVMLAATSGTRPFIGVGFGEHPGQWHWQPPPSADPRRI